MVPPRRRRRPGSRAAVGVCAGGRGLGVASTRAPRAPCHCLGPCRLSPSRLSSELSLPQFALSPAPRLPTLARSLSPSLPPSLAHKQDGGCCFFPLPNPPYRLAVAAAAGNEPRGGGEKKGRGWASRGRWQWAGPGPEPLSQWGKRTRGRGRLQSRDPPKAPTRLALPQTPPASPGGSL